MMLREWAIQQYAKAKHDPDARYWDHELALATKEIAALEAIGLLKFDEPVDKSNQSAVFPK